MNDLKQELLSKFDLFKNIPIKKSEVIIDKLEQMMLMTGAGIFLLEKWKKSKTLVKKDLIWFLIFSQAHIQRIST